MEAERDDGETLARAIVRAMDSLTTRYCTIGTRDKLHEEIKALRKTRSMSVSAYAAKFEDFVSLERWILPDDGNLMRLADQCRYFSARMPRQGQFQVVPQNERWTDRALLRDRYLQCERIDQQPQKEMYPREKKNKDGKGKKQGQRPPEKKGQAERKEDRIKRERETTTGCTFCKLKGNVWKNHHNDECFRNPAFPCFKPRANKDQARSGRPPRGAPQVANWSAPTAAAARTEPDPLSYWQEAQEAQDQAAAVQTHTIGTPTKWEPLLTTITLKPPLSKRSYRVLLDTGTTKSLVA
ncbi:hypothetical protein PC121_g3861 [Phytophthora cactorum]|nr:hypothetical protein PC120_g22740 [Phytophthora cactorum]KAG3091448.1 hypothetical protein PC121_g3861 [Phytophthora cactorum]KAG4041210.1 hypothetical protein PC123_g23268 [Phytophthora cactorum]